MKNIHLSDVIDSKLLESFYTEYDGYCMNLHEGGFYVEWLNKEEFFERIKTYGDLVKIHISIGYIESVLGAYYLGSLPQEEPKIELYMPKYTIGIEDTNEQEEPKQETIEEAAERLFPSKMSDYEIFLLGAKWQAERMYSEEEVRFIATRFAHECRLKNPATNNDTIVLFDEWFEQHKKK